MDIEKSVQAAMRLLHYKREWLDYGFVESEFLAEQVKGFRTGIDPHREHYRCAAFRRILLNRVSLTQEELEHYIELCRLDEDTTMAGAMLCDLLGWSGLTPDQFEFVSSLSDFEPDFLQKTILQMSLLKALQQSPLTEATFARCLDSQDITVQLQLLLKHSLTLQQWEILAERGASRAIRNRAKERLPRPKKLPRLDT
ncbi:MAG: hypothetical protein H7308_08740 [Chthonomonadaceae bacterium]|nr:hypothetical protein [Chthonomonadaceae bacterium]